MSDFFKLLQEADIASLEMERAKLTVEVAKETWEKAKEDYEEARKAFEKVLFKADEMAIPRQRIRKLIDDRTQALVSSGLLEAEAKASLGKSGKQGSKAGKKSAKNKSELSAEMSKESPSAELN